MSEEANFKKPDKGPNPQKAFRYQKNVTPYLFAFGQPSSVGSESPKLKLTFKDSPELIN